ncbi:hypothetical protein J6590_075862 [Homalodisca vitripennis]|nr:hypothetical protein J6590_075862 [Homalodisca vitripennis]
MNSLKSSAIGSDKTSIQMMKAVSLNAVEALTHLENHDVIYAKVRGDWSMIVLLDYSKAFDSINHKLLMEKVNYYNFGVGAIHSRVRYQLLLRERERGVLQGSCLGPIRFNLYTSELVSRAARHIYTLMIPHKTTYRKYSNGGLGVTFGGGSLSICDKIKTLGVVLDSELSFADHVSYNMRDYRNPTHAVFRYKFSIIVTLHMGNMTLRYVFAMRRKDHVSQYRDAVNILRMGNFCKLHKLQDSQSPPTQGLRYQDEVSQLVSRDRKLHFSRFREQGGWVRVALGGEGEGVSEGGYWRLNISRQCSAVLRGEELCFAVQVLADDLRILPRANLKCASLPYDGLKAWGKMSVQSWPTVVILCLTVLVFDRLSTIHSLLDNHQHQRGNTRDSEVPNVGIGLKVNPFTVSTLLHGKRHHFKSRQEKVNLNVVSVEKSRAQTTQHKHTSKVGQLTRQFMSAFPFYSGIYFLGGDITACFRHNETERRSQEGNFQVTTSFGGLWMHVMPGEKLSFHVTE